MPDATEPKSAVPQSVLATALDPDSDSGGDHLHQQRQLDQLDQIGADLDTVESSLASLDDDDLDQAEALAGSLSESADNTDGPAHEA